MFPSSRKLHLFFFWHLTMSRRLNKAFAQKKTFIIDL